MADGRLRAIELQMDGMRQAFNNNHRAYAQAVSALDGHIAVLRAVINDIHRGDLTVDAEGNIDWDTYYAWYNQYLEKQSRDEASAAQGTVVEAVEKIPEEQVFGGDYGGRTG